MVPMTVSRSCAPIAAGLIALLALSAWPAAAQDIVTRAKNLYQTADYDQALSVLDQLKNDPVAEAMPDVAAYRVFCLLALGRSDEAHDNIATILRHDPGYQPSESEASPRIRAVFQDVRRRLLPQVFQERYETAKATFERKEYQSASDQFQMLLRLIEDPAVVSDASRPDMRMLISGFADIAQAAISAQARVSSPPPAAPSDSATPASSIKPPPSRGTPAAPPPAPATAARQPGSLLTGQIYSAADTAITPPLALSKVIPPFRPAGADHTREFAGVVELLVNDRGDVVDAKIQKSVY